MSGNRRKRLVYDGEPRRTGFWYTTHAGNSAHIQGDPHMSQETLDALEALIDAAHRAIADGTLGKRGCGHELHETD